MMELADMLGLGSSSIKRVRVQVPFLVKMWEFVAGRILSILFNYLILKYYKNKLSSKQMTKIEKILGWFLQEHIKQDFNVTAGKRFMTNKDFRNKFITNIIKIIRNVFFLSQIIMMFELGSLIAIFVIFGYLMWSHISNKKLQDYKIQDFLSFLFLFFFTIQIIRIYSIFDFYFIASPFFIVFCCMCVFFLTFQIFCFFFKYLSTISKKTMLFSSFFFVKFIFYIAFIILFRFILFYIILLENKYSNNFYQEFLIKTFLLIHLA